MEYFMLKSSAKTPLKPINIDTKRYQYRLTKENFNRIPRSEVYYFQNTDDIEIPELMVHPTFMVGETLKDIISLYDDTIIWKSLYLVPNEEEKMIGGTKHYQIPRLKRYKCLHPETEKQPNGAITKLILDKQRIRNMDIFQVQEAQENFVLVSLALAESISRRNLYGVRLERVEVR